jgi:hypothetical protein
MIAVVVEKFTYAAALIVLYLQGRLHRSDLTFGIVDLLLGFCLSSRFLKLVAREGRWIHVFRIFSARIGITPRFSFTFHKKFFSSTVFTQPWLNLTLR